MTDEATGITSTPRGEVLPPLEPGEPGKTLAPLSIPVLTEIRNWSERRQLESYVKLYRVRVEMLSLLAQEQQRATELDEARQRALIRLEHRSDLRAIESWKVQKELRELRADAELHAMRVELEKEELNVRLAEMKLRRAALENPASEAPGFNAAERVAHAFESARDIDAAIHAQRQKMVDAVGGEDNLTDADRARLDQLQMLGNVMVESLIEKLSGEVR